MTTALAPTRPQTGVSQTTLVPLAAREMRRFVVNPVFLFAVVMTAWTTWTPSASDAATEIDSVTCGSRVLTNSPRTRSPWRRAARAAGWDLDPT